MYSLTYLEGQKPQSIQEYCPVSTLLFTLQHGQKHKREMKKRQHKESHDAMTTDQQQHRR